MGRLLLLVTIVAAILVPTGLAADPVPGDFKNAAKYCKALRTAKGVDAFQTHFGTNANKRNAFGKCVSATAKAKAKAKAARADDDDHDDDKAESAAEAKCKAERTANAVKFAQDYKNFGQCVKAAKGESHAKSAKNKSAKDDDEDDDEDDD